jgi:hypothetical protein
MSITELRILLPTPSAPEQVPTEDDWHNAEQTLGTELPLDYKEFLDAYGSGKIDDFLWVLMPADPNPYGNLITYWREQKAVFEVMQKGCAPLPFDLHPASPGLLPLGQTDNGDTMFYLCIGMPNDWRIAWLPSRGDLQVFELGLTAFLAAAMRHELDVLPNDLAAHFLPIAD